MRGKLTEKKVHEVLLDRCEDLVKHLRTTWEGELDGTAISWASREIKDDKGRTINDAVLLQMPDDKKEWQPLLEEFVVRTEAFALMLVDRLPDEVKVIFESPFGSRSWRLKKEWHGDVAVLSRPTVADNVDSIGLLWSPNRGSA